jgi:hypothetical protein
MIGLFLNQFDSKEVKGPKKIVVVSRYIKEKMSIMHERRKQ